MSTVIDVLQYILESCRASIQNKKCCLHVTCPVKCVSFLQITRNTTPMYRTPEIVDLYSNFPISEKQDIWVRPHCPGARQPCLMGPRAQVPAAVAQGATFPLLCSFSFNFFFVFWGGSGYLRVRAGV